MKKQTPPYLTVVLLLLTVLLLSACKKDLGKEIPALNTGSGTLDNAIPLPLPAQGDSGADSAEAYPVVIPDPATLDTTATGEQPVEPAGEAAAETQPAADGQSAEPVVTEADSGAVENPPPPPPEQPQTTTDEQATVVHIVQQGETIGSIADRYNVTIDDIIAANNIVNVHLVSIGEELQIVPGAATQAQTDQAAQAGNTGYDPNNYFIHTVGYGDTLFVLAQRYGFTVEELAAYNGITDINRIDLNQEIRIPIR